MPSKLATIFSSRWAADLKVISALTTKLKIRKPCSFQGIPHLQCLQQIVYNHQTIISSKIVQSTQAHVLFMIINWDLFRHLFQKSKKIVIFFRNQSRHRNARIYWKERFMEKGQNLGPMWVCSPMLVPEGCKLRVQSESLWLPCTLLSGKLLLNWCHSFFTLSLCVISNMTCSSESEIFGLQTPSCLRYVHLMQHDMFWVPKNEKTKNKPGKTHVLLPLVCQNHKKSQNPGTVQMK